MLAVRQSSVPVADDGERRHLQPAWHAFLENTYGILDVAGYIELPRQRPPRPAIWRIDVRVDATSFVALGPVKVRELLVPALVAHVRKYPTGMIIVNDLQHLRTAIDVLSPLLTGGHYPEFPDVSFAGVVLVMTTGMDTVGATELMSTTDIKAAAAVWLVRVGMGLIASRADIVPFLPVEVDTLGP
jgi:hypothetical protein